MRKNKIYFDLIYIVACVFSILLVYQIISIINDNVYVVPDLKLVFIAVAKLLQQKSFWLAFCGTFFRTIIGFTASFILALSLSVIYKYFRLSKKFISILIAIIRAIPTIAIILGLLMWTNSKIAPVIISCLVTLPQLFSSITEQIQNFDSDIVDMCKLYNISDREIFFKVYIPFVMPRLALSLCSNFALTLKLMSSSEALCSTLNSIGFLMKDARDSLDPARLIAIAIICVILAIILENSLRFIIKKIWRIKND